VAALQLGPGAQVTEETQRSWFEQAKPRPQTPPLQQGWPELPQAATQIPVFEQTRAPLQTLPLQQGCFSAPHVPPAQTPPEQTRDALHVLPPQQGSPEPPQATQVPRSQTRPVAQAPLQQDWPSPPPQTPPAQHPAIAQAEAFTHWLPLQQAPCALPAQPHVQTPLETVEQCGHWDCAMQTPPLTPALAQHIGDAQPWQLPPLQLAQAQVDPDRTQVCAVWSQQ
jgi:hypothetical protein